jgi:hypothetical protein
MEFEENESFEGTYLSSKENVGPNDSMMYEFRALDGSSVSVWGSTVLDNKMKHIAPDTRVRIVSLGMKKSPKSAHN